MKKNRKKLQLHRETLQEIHKRDIWAAAGREEVDGTSLTLNPTEVWSSCPPCD